VDYDLGLAANAVDELDPAFAPRADRDPGELRLAVDHLEKRTGPRPLATMAALRHGERVGLPLQWISVTRANCPGRSFPIVVGARGARMKMERPSMSTRGSMAYTSPLKVLVRIGRQP